MWPADVVQHYERLRAQVVADEEERVVCDRTVSAEILIRQGLIGWATRWSGDGLVRKDHYRAAEAAPVSEAEVPGACDRDTEITRILVNMTVPHLLHSRIPGKEVQR